MLFVIELLFLVAGLWGAISGKLPARLLRLLFGKGEYELPADRVRLYSLLLASPLPIALFVSILLTAIFGSDAIGLAVAFEYLYLFVIIILAIVVARRIRRPQKSM